MSVMVYPLLGALLRDRDMTVSALAREIARPYGTTVERAALERLMQPAPIQRADMEIAGAVVEVLDVGLDDLFGVRAARDGRHVETAALLSERHMQPGWTLCGADRYLHILVQRGQKTQQAVDGESIELAGHNQRHLGLRRAE